MLKSSQPPLFKYSLCKMVFPISSAHTSLNQTFCTKCASRLIPVRSNKAIVVCGGYLDVVGIPAEFLQGY
ncbi:hypothetical protein [Candidatus Lucifugimonas marina]|uniref:Uncharacterized protein n=1 Tax=Candidatus Lucifugimonas marina TaxID=3038979 RepID=A0ABD4XT65_9CHLR|nr:hypothetical protein [SAR202 cluster bacterium JH702]MDG0869998.1 hypothetical protein [SAR202 cluster bacterium JH639]